MRDAKPMGKGAHCSNANSPHTRKLHPVGRVGGAGSAPLRRIESQQVQRNGSTQYIKVYGDITLSSDRGTLELSGVNLMYEGTSVKSWLVERDLNPAGRGAALTQVGPARTKRAHSWRNPTKQIQGESLQGAVDEQEDIF